VGCAKEVTRETAQYNVMKLGRLIIHVALELYSKKYGLGYFKQLTVT